MHKALHVPDQDNPTVPMLYPPAASFLQRAPLLAIGTLDGEARPWTTIWGGEPGFSQPLGQSIIGVRTAVSTRHDPVVGALVGTEADGEVVREEAKGRMVGGLAIDLESRRRFKYYGRMMAGALNASSVDADSGIGDGTGEIQLVVKIEQALGNCPKYLNAKHIVPAAVAPQLVSAALPLPPEATALLARADLFFITSSHSTYDMDTNHRGGPPGFVRVLSNTAAETVLVYPEYSGNRLYQTLGNLATTPLAGLCVPDFDTGAALYVTGTTEILVGQAAAALLPRSNLAVKITLTASRYVHSVLPFRGIPGQASPYNPQVRYLATESLHPSTISAPAQVSAATATLITQTPLTPSISCFRFRLSPSKDNATAVYKPGQYVTLSFAEHLDHGYSHMRDQDPRSLNDDFVRTFTVSSPPPGLSSTSISTSTSKPGPGPRPRPSEGPNSTFPTESSPLALADNEFEITIRRVGVVTDFLFGYGLGKRGREEVEVGVLGFGGEFEVQLPAGRDSPSGTGTGEGEGEGEGVVGFVAAGVGITPLLPSLIEWPREHPREGEGEHPRGQEQSFRGLDVWWTVRRVDVGLVLHALKAHPGLGKSVRLFLTGDGTIDGEVRAELEGEGCRIVERRMVREDLNREGEGEGVGRWHVCAGTMFRKMLLLWLEGEEVVFEDFNF